MFFLDAYPVNHVIYKWKEDQSIKMDNRQMSQYVLTNISTRAGEVNFGEIGRNMI